MLSACGGWSYIHSAWGGAIPHRLVRQKYRLRSGGASTCEMLRLSSDEYLPLSSFEGESGYFYNKSAREVINLSLGSDMVDFLEGRKKPEWKSFSDFLEHFFELSTNE